MGDQPVDMPRSVAASADVALWAALSGDSAEFADLPAEVIARDGMEVTAHIGGSEWASALA